MANIVNLSQYKPATTTKEEDAAEAKALADRPAFEQTGIEGRKIKKRVEDVTGGLSDGELENLVAEGVDFINFTQLLDHTVTTARKGPAGFGPDQSITSAAGSGQHGQSHVYSVKEMDNYRRRFNDAYGPVEGDAKFRELENSNQSFVNNLWDDGKETITGLMWGLPIAVKDSAVGAIRQGWRSMNPNLSMKDRVTASKAMQNHIAAIPDMYIGGQLSGYRQSSKGMKGIKQAPLEVLFTYLGVQGLVAAGRGAMRAGKLKGSVGSRVVPTGSKIDSAKQVAEIAAGDAKDIARQANIDFQAATSMNIVKTAEDALRSVHKSASEGTGTGLPGVKDKVLGWVSGQAVEKLFDSNFLLDAQFAERLRDTPVNGRANFWKQFNTIDDISVLSPEKVRMLEEVLIHGSDQGSINQAYKAVALVNQVKKAIKRVNEAEKTTIDSLMRETRKEHAKAVKKLEGAISEIDQNIKDSIVLSGPEKMVSGTKKALVDQDAEGKIAAAEDILAAPPRATAISGQPLPDKRVAGYADPVEVVMSNMDAPNVQVLMTVLESNPSLKKQAMADFDLTSPDQLVELLRSNEDLQRKVAQATSRENMVTGMGPEEVLASNPELVETVGPRSMARPQRSSEASKTVSSKPLSALQQGRAAERVHVAELRGQLEGERAVMADLNKESTMNVRNSIKERNNILTRLKRPTKKGKKAAEDDALLDTLIEDTAALDLLEAKEMGKVDKALSQEMLKNAKAIKVGGSSLAQWFAEHGKNPYMTFLYDGVPMDGLAFFFRGAEDALAAGRFDPKTNKKGFDPEKISVEVVDPKYKGVAEAAVRVKMALGEMAALQSGINVGTAANPIPFNAAHVLAANTPSYATTSRRQGKLGVEKAERQLEREMSFNRDPMALTDDLIDVSEGALRQSTMIDRTLGPKERKVLARVDESVISKDEKREAGRLMMAEDFAIGLQAGMMKTHREMAYYKTLNEVFDEAATGFDQSGPERFIYKDKADLQANGPKGMLSNSFVPVPSVKKGTGKDAALMFGPLTGTYMRKREFEALKKMSGLDKIADIMTKNMASPAIKGLLDARDVYASAINYSRTMSTVTNPIYFYNTISGYAQMLALEGVNPASMVTNAQRNMKPGNPYLQKFLESGEAETTAMMYGVMNDAGINPQLMGFSGALGKMKETVVTGAKEARIDWKQLGDVSKKIAEEKAKRTKSVDGVLAKSLKKEGGRLSKALLTLPENLKSLFTLNGFNSAFAAMIDVSARVTMFEHLVKRKADHLKISPEKVLADPRLVREIAKKTNDDMIHYNDMGKLHEWGRKYLPWDPFHAWYVRSTSRLLRYGGEHPILSRTALSAEKERRAIMSEELREARRKLPVRIRDFAFKLGPDTNKDLWLSVVYNSIFEPTQIDPYKLLTFGFAMEPKTERAVVEREMRERQDFEQDVGEKGKYGKLNILQKLAAEFKASGTQTDMGLMKMYNSVSGRSDFWDLSRDPVASDMTRMSNAARDFGLPTLVNFYMGKELMSFLDGDMQAKMRSEHGEMRSQTLNLNPAELVIRSLGPSLFRESPDNDRISRAVASKITLINREFDDRLRDADGDAEKRDAIERLRSDVIEMMENIADDLNAKGKYQ